MGEKFKLTPELEVLDQLQGGDMPLVVIASLFEDRARFLRAISRMIDAGEVQLRDASGEPIPLWRFQELARIGGIDSAASSIRISLGDR